MAEASPTTEEIFNWAKDKGCSLPVITTTETGWGKTLLFTVIAEIDGHKIRCQSPEKNTARETALTLLMTAKIGRAHV